MEKLYFCTVIYALEKYVLKANSHEQSNPPYEE